MNSQDNKYDIIMITYNYYNYNKWDWRVGEGLSVGMAEHSSA